MGSVTAIKASGTKYACQRGSRAPENKLVAPTGAKFGGCGNRRAVAPSTVRDKARGRQLVLFINRDYSSAWTFANFKRLRRMTKPIKPVPISRYVPASGAAETSAGPAVPK